MGGYKATVGADISDERPGYFIFEPFANRARGEFSAGNDFELMSVAITVGETRSVVTLSAGNELDFVTPRLVTGIWSSGTVSGTNRFTLLAGDPTATLRIVGIEIDEGQTVSGLYALDYFDFDDSFRGQYYDVKTDKISALSYDLQGGAWPAAMMTANLTLGGNDVITLEFARKDDNYGEFEGIGDYDGLSGTWCDLAAAASPLRPSRRPHRSRQSRRSRRRKATARFPSHGARLRRRRITNCIGRRQEEDRSRGLEETLPQPIMSTTAILRQTLLIIINWNPATTTGVRIVRAKFRRQRRRRRH